MTDWVQHLVSACEEESLGLHGLTVLQDGEVVAKCNWLPYELDQQHIMFSVSKTFTSSAIGILQGEGGISVSELVEDVFPTYATRDVRHNLHGMKVRDVLAMSTGHATDTMVLMRDLPRRDWVKIFLESPVAYPPGQHWLYNSGASFLLSAMVQARTGQTVRDYLRPRLFEPLGIECPPWMSNERGINLGASGLRLRVGELARLGQLYLQDGVWDGRRVLPEGWVKEATSVQAVNGDPSTGDDWQQGYGYQLWRCRYGAYRADGAFGQFCVVDPERRLVVAITSGSQRNRRVMELLWAHMPPAEPAKGQSVRMASARAGGECWHDVRSMTVTGELDQMPALEEKIGEREYELPPNLLGLKRFRLVFGASTCDFIGTGMDDRRYVVRCGRGKWLPAESDLWEGEEPEMPLSLAARAGWTKDGEFVLSWQYLNTPFRRVVRVRPMEEATEVHMDLDLPFWTERKISAKVPGMAVMPDDHGPILGRNLGLGGGR